MVPSVLSFRIFCEKKLLYSPGSVSYLEKKITLKLAPGLCYSIMMVTSTLSEQKFAGGNNPMQQSGLNEKKPDPFVEKRRNERFPVPDACKQGITLEVKHGDSFIPATLANFSRSGILFECPVPFEKEFRTECIVRISLVLARQISFSINIMYCYSNGGSHIMGASIDTISDQTWFDAFVEVHDLIVQRQCS